jgi:hypothetical protein
MSELKVDKVSPRSGNYVALNTVGMKNIIINGDMSIAQRGTSATGLGNGDNGYYTCDRWKFTEAGAATAEFTQTQSTDVPTGQGFATSLKMDCTTAQGSLGASDIFRIQQHIEGQNLQYLKKGTSSAESLTLSFWVKSNKTGTYTVYFYDADNTRLNSKSYTIDSASTWEKKTITISGDTTGTLDNDNNLSLLISFQLFAGTDYTSGTLQDWGTSTTANFAPGQVNLADSTANEWYITGVQLEAGTSASDFEFLPYDVNLDRCMRYCQIIGDTTDANVSYAVGMANSTANFRGVYSFKKEMRATPSATVSSASDFRIFENGTANVITALSFNQLSKRSCQVDADTSGLVQGQACIFRKLTSQDSAKVTLDAEL